MNEFPIDGLEFRNRFGTEEKCELVLEKMRWPKGFICPNCGHDDGYRLKGRRQIQCAVCRHQCYGCCLVFVSVAGHVSAGENRQHFCSICQAGSGITIYLHLLFDARYSRLKLPFYSQRAPSCLSVTFLRQTRVISEQWCHHDWCSPISVILRQARAIHTRAQLYRIRKQMMKICCKQNKRVVPKRWLQPLWHCSFLRFQLKDSIFLGLA
jgi:hypothetical protein